jgi:hypothetical protein
MEKKTIISRYTSIALVALLSLGVGWGASALTMGRSETPAASASAPVAFEPGMASSLTPMVQPQALAPVAFEPAPVVIQRSSAPRSIQTVRAERPRRISAPVNDTVDPAPAPVATPVKKGGLSNGVKTAIVIGGGAATGAIIGGVAGGKKGAAIGAAIGGGGGAIYSILRNKKGKDIW